MRFIFSKLVPHIFSYLIGLGALQSEKNSQKMDKAQPTHSMAHVVSSFRNRISLHQVSNTIYIEDNNWVDLQIIGSGS